MIKKTKLKNGIKVLLVPMDSTKAVVASAQYVPEWGVGNTTLVAVIKPTSRRTSY